MSSFYKDLFDRGGTVLTRELQEPKAYYGIKKEVDSGNVLRIKNGVYMLPEELANSMIDVERIIPGGVVCMYSAWTYYGLTTQIPNGYYVAIEKHRKVVAPEICNIVLCYWEQKYCSIGVEDAVISNHKVKIFCREKRGHLQNPVPSLLQASNTNLFILPLAHSCCGLYYSLEAEGIRTK